VRLVAHQPVEHELRAGDDRPRERRGVLRRVQGRAADADAHPPTERPPAGIDVDAHPHRRARASAGGGDRVEVLRAVDHHRDALARRPGGQRLQGGAIDRRIGDHDVVVILGQPQRLRECERQHAT
jgi:hypothetical protein